MVETCFVAIGRNIEGVPMEEHRWGHFVKDLLHMLAKCEATVLTHAYGAGVWDENLQESFIVSFACPNTAIIEAELSYLAYLYEQAAIILTVGHTQVIAP